MSFELKRPHIDVDSIVSFYLYQQSLEPKKCEKCRRLAKSGTTRCKNHPLENRV